MNENKIALGSVLVLVLVLFAVLAISVASASEYYLAPDDSIVTGYGSTTEVQLRLNATQEIQTGKVTILYDTPCACITDFTHDPEWEGKTRASYPGEYIVTFSNKDDYGIPVNLSAGDHLIGTYTIQCNSTTYGVTDLIFASSSPHSPTWATDLAAIGVPDVPFTVDNGTFACTGVPETFEKELVVGWNLISLPLTATDMTVANVIDTSLSGTYDALYKYDVATHSFLPLSPTDTMDNGVGYFINMTAADTWSYEGTPKESIEVGLSQGLNMVGWVNESGSSLPDALNSITGKYNYVARWNATSQSYEVYEPNAPAVFNDFDTMARGEGYFIAASEECTLEYPTP